MRSATVVLALAAGFAAFCRVVPVLAQEDETEATEPAAPAEPAGAGSAVPSEASDGGGTDADEPVLSGEAAASSSPIDEFFNGTTLDNVKSKSEQFYGPNATMEDPFGRFEGRDAIIAHLTRLYEGINTVTFEVKEEFVSGDETVALWTMTLSHKSLKSGETISVDGVSHVRFEDGKAVMQRDYYDLGGLVYENTPIVGRIVRWVKAKVEDE